MRPAGPDVEKAIRVVATGMVGVPSSQWWAVMELNQQPPRCKRGALPIELTARGGCSVY